MAEQSVRGFVERLGMDMVHGCYGCYGGFNN